MQVAKTSTLIEVCNLPVRMASSRAGNLQPHFVLPFPPSMPRLVTHRRLGIASVMVLVLLVSGMISYFVRSPQTSSPVAQVIPEGGDNSMNSGINGGLNSGNFSSMGGNLNGDNGLFGTAGGSSVGGGNSSTGMLGGDNGGGESSSAQSSQAQGSSMGMMGGEIGIFGGASSEPKGSSQGFASSQFPGSSAPASSSAAPASSPAPASSSAAPPSSSRAPSSSAGLSSPPPPPSSSSAAPVRCGDGRTELPETCDPCAPSGRPSTDPNCNAVCSPGRCGDGYLDRRRGEECDYVGLVYDATLSPSFSRDESTFQQCAADAACPDGYCIYGKCWPLRWIGYWGWLDTALCPQSWTPLPAWTPSTPPPGVPCNDFTSPQCREFAGDGCTISCKLERCGDRIIQAGYTSPAGKHYGLSEQCDDGNSVSGDGCSDRCLFETAKSSATLSSAVSSGFSLCLQFPHLCAPLSISSSSTSSLLAFTYSLPPRTIPESSSSIAPSSVAQSSSTAASLSLAQPTSSICGDGRLDTGEECDNGTLNSNTVSGACRSDCRSAFCGDFIADYSLGEQCDQGIGNSAGVPDRCRPGCILPNCGDNVLDRSEACDDGNAFSGDGCSSTCGWESVVAEGPRCGDGRIQTGEFCDDGNTSSGDGCSPLCEMELVLGVREEINPILVAGGVICGDGVTSPGEECDDGNPFPGDGCSTICKYEAPICGNSVIEAGEACDPPGPTCSAVCAALELKPAAQEPLPFVPVTVQPYAFIALPPPVAPIGDTGPAAVAVMASGAAGAIGWMRRKKRKEKRE